MADKEFIRAILTADTEKAVKLLDERPELAIQELPYCDVTAVYNDLVYPRGPVGQICLASYDASNGFRYKPGYIDRDAARRKWNKDELPIKINRFNVTDKRFNVTDKAFLQPIQLCWAPSHKETAEKLLEYGAGINDRRKDERDESGNCTLLFNTINGFPLPGVCVEGLTEYAEYIKWLVSQGASMAEPAYLPNGANGVWGTLYDLFYRAVKEYVLDAGSDYLTQNDDGHITAYLDIIEDLTKFLFKDIDKSRYIPYDAYTGDGLFLQTRPRRMDTLPFCKANIAGMALNSPGILSSLEVTLNVRALNHRPLPSEAAERLLEIILYPVEKTLELFSQDELRYICQKEEWYRTMTYNIIKRNEPGNGWEALWNTLNRYVPVKEVRAGIMPVADCIRTIQTAGRDDTLGKIEAYERALGADMVRDEGERRMIWPALAYGAAKRFGDSASFNTIMSDKQDNQNLIESLCEVADRYGAGINRADPITGTTPAHIFCKYMYQAYKKKKPTSRSRAQTIEQIAVYLDMFKRYGADLSVTDKDGKTPTEAFPKDMRMSIAKYLKQTDLERASLIEDVEIYSR